MENEEINWRCRRWVGAWVGDVWRNCSLLREDRKSVRTNRGERGATGRNGEGGERKYIYIYIYSNHQCEHKIK